MRSILKSGALFAILASGLVAKTDAHHPWVLAEPSHAPADTSVQVLLFFGHSFPFDDPMHPDRVAELILLSPAADAIHIDPKQATTSPLTKGVHVVGLRQARGYWSQTTEGGRPQPRSELQNVVSCAYSDNSAKTLIIVGEGGPSAAGQAVGHRLEILTDADVTRLTEGDLVQFRVLLEGQTHAGPVMAFHADSGEDPWLISESDSAGLIELVLEGPGPWMLLAQAEIDYPDPAECDVERFYSSLSFGHASL